LLSAIQQKYRKGGDMEYHPSEDLKALLTGEKFKLDCGHLVTFGHNLANTVIIYSDGKGIRTACHS
jgi:hypothetical protein